MNSRCSSDAQPVPQRTRQIGASKAAGGAPDSSSAMLELVKPLIRCFHDYSFMFGISGRCRDRENFIFSNYGNLSFIRTMWIHHWDPFDFFPAPRIEQWGESGLINAKRHDLGISMRSPSGEIVEFARSNLLEGRSCLVMLDEFFVKSRRNYGIRHVTHNLLVVGFDDRRREIALLGYFRLADGDYGVQWVSYDDFTKAFHYSIHDIDATNKSQVEETIWWHKCVETYEPVEDAAFEFSLASVAKEVDGYLNSSFSPDQRRYHHKELAGLDVSYGLGIYETFLAYLDSVHTECNAVEDVAKLPITHPPLRIFWEHKAVMVEKFKFIDRRGHAPIDPAIHDDLAKILRLARKLSVTLLENHCYKDKATMKIALDCLSQCREIEERCYPRIAKALARA